MKSSPSLRSDIVYIRHLTQAVLDGITSVPEETAGRARTPVLSNAVWTPAAIGAALGLLSASLGGKHKPRYRVAVGGLLGTALGFSAGVAWTHRAFTGQVVRNTLRNINSVRDARWLEKNPIAYA